MLTEKQKIVKKILLTPIICDKKQKNIELKDNTIYSGQTYYSTADEDMSDIAIEFYKIIYKNLVNNNLILDNGYLINKEFAGDTMCSYNTLYKILKNTNFKQLEEYKHRYHCLANFWLIPMRHGRTSAKLSRYDSVDNYCKTILENYDKYSNDNFIYYKNIKYKNYFKIIKKENFIKINFIPPKNINLSNPLDCYTEKNLDIKIKKCKKELNNNIRKIENRAEEIIRNKIICEQLYKMFERYNLTK